ncbi:MAG: phosphotransferase, partial [Verrucomicrobiales bacterium]|nr:phosphotransferase [Verrucomicrobiales bacterium]
RLSDDRLAEIAEEFGLAVSDLEFVGGFENRVYAFRSDGRDLILRIGHDGRRSELQVRSELIWLEFLHNGGASVSAPAAPGGYSNLARIADGSGGKFISTSFDRAKGARPEPGTWDDEFFRTYGRALGRIHCLSRQFSRPPAFDRPHWDDESELARLKSFLPDGEILVADRLDNVREGIRRLPSDPDRYGMIHQDPHVGNLMMDHEGGITLFDFDDCVFGHYLYDIAMVFFYAGMSDPEPAELVGRFIRPFLSGYREENFIPGDCLEAIPLFMKLREIDLYAVIHRSFDVATTDDEWVLGFLNGDERRRRIENDVPWIDFDWSKY